MELGIGSCSWCPLLCIYVTELEGDVRTVSLYNLCAQNSDSPYSLSYSA